MVGSGEEGRKLAAREVGRMEGWMKATRHLRRLVLTGLQFYQTWEGNIYVLDGTLSHISHKTFFAESKGEMEYIWIACQMSSWIIAV